MAITDTYVDPSIAANTGTGTIGDPYGDLQYAFDSTTHNTTDGDRMYLEAGTPEVLAASISLALFGSPTEQHPLILQGHGGLGQISCTSFPLYIGFESGIGYYDLDLTGTTAAQLISLRSYGSAIRCKFSGTTGYGIWTGSASTLILGCWFEDIGDSTHAAINSGNAGTIRNNYIKQGASKTMLAGIQIGGDSDHEVTGNIISVDGASHGIYISNSFASRHTITDNTVFSVGGTGTGIKIPGNRNSRALALLNNYVEGFSGTGGNGIYNSPGSEGNGIYGQNAVYNNTTNYTFAPDSHLLLGDNEVLSVSGLTKSGADTFANRFEYFKPVDTGNMIAGGYPEA